MSTTWSTTEPASAWTRRAILSGPCVTRRGDSSATRPASDRSSPSRSSWSSRRQGRVPSPAALSATFRSSSTRRACRPGPRAGAGSSRPTDTSEQVEQLLGRHRLHQVVVEARGPRALAVSLLPPPRQGDDERRPFGARPPGAAADGGGDLVAVLAGQAEVEDDDVGLARQGHGEGLVAVVGEGNRGAGPSQDGAQRNGGVLVVVDDE